MSETHKEHPSPTKYVQIAIVLAILTAIEVALYYTEDIVGALAPPLLIILAVGKFVIVVGWFMHLRYENSLVNKFFAGGMILALILFAIVMIERAVGNFFNMILEWHPHFDVWALIISLVIFFEYTTDNNELKNQRENFGILACLFSGSLQTGQYMILEKSIYFQFTLLSILYWHLFLPHCFFLVYTVQENYQ